MYISKKIYICTYFSIKIYIRNGNRQAPNQGSRKLVVDIYIYISSLQTQQRASLYIGIYNEPRRLYIIFNYIYV